MSALAATTAAVLLAAAVVDAAGAAAPWLARHADGPAIRRLLDDPRLERLVPAVVVAGGLLALAGGGPTGVLAAGAAMLLRAAAAGRRARRRRALGRGVPLVARAVADGLDAGLPVRGALADAAVRGGIGGPAGEELRRLAGRLAAGDPLPAALAAWRRRADEPGHATLVAGLLLHGEAGGELIGVLRGHADALERSRRALAEAESATVQARTAARIVGGIPVAIGLGTLALAPEAIRAVTGTLLGATLVAAAVVLQALAAVAVRRLTAGLA